MHIFTSLFANKERRRKQDSYCDYIHISQINIDGRIINRVIAGYAFAYKFILWIETASKVSNVAHWPLVKDISFEICRNFDF